MTMRNKSSYVTALSRKSMPLKTSRKRGAGKFSNWQFVRGTSWLRLVLVIRDRLVGDALLGVPMTVTDPNNTLAIRSLLRRPSLTAERERSLLKACRSSSDDAGRQPARSELWQNHSKLAVAVAR